MTISKGKIFADYHKAKRLLNKLEFKFNEDLQKAGTLLKTDLSQDFIRASYKEDYRNIYRIARENSDFNIKLEFDGAIFQFGYEENDKEQICDLRYAFFESPSYQISYEEFLINNDFDIEECGYELIEEYSQFLTEAEFKNTVTTFRYDYSENQYKELIHPVSHLHIGHANEVRIPLSFIMTPLSFVAFVIRHMYWHHWRIQMNDSDIRRLYLDSHSSCKQIVVGNFSNDEKNDIFLNVL